jgi:hypothetical protein
VDSATIEITTGAFLASVGMFGTIISSIRKVKSES